MYTVQCTFIMAGGVAIQPLLGSTQQNVTSPIELFMQELGVKIGRCHPVYICQALFLDFFHVQLVEGANAVVDVKLDYVWVFDEYEH